MLVCPHCQFDNPNTNHFCQNCGGSLIYTHCHECGEKVVFSEENCPKCGAMTGVTWWAVIADSLSDDGGAVPEGKYLDRGKRYRLSTVSTATREEKISFWQSLVLDCQPLQKSVLKVLLEDQAELQNLETAYRTGFGQIPSWLPKLAIPYLLLKDFSPAVPELHEAWQEETTEVILVEDRSQWQYLADVVDREAPPALQLVYWFDEMAKLWKVLAEVGCCQSLLVKNNLLLDEDRTFGLQKLYQDQVDTPPNLQSLTQLWREFPHPSEDFHSLALQKLLNRAIEGEIESVTELRLQLQELGDEQSSFEEDQTGDIQSLSEKSAVFTASERESSEEPSITLPHETTLVDAHEGDELPTAVIPMQLLSLTDVGCTDNGRQRRHNEDCFGIINETHRQQNNCGQKVQGRGLYIVCDGMGGHAAGEVASALAVETLQKYFEIHGFDKMPSKETIEQGILLANQTVYQVNQEKETYGSGRMGTTLVLAFVQDTRVAIAHVGDSRIYRVNRKWGLEQLTVDHEVGQRSIQEGIDPKIAYARPDAYQLTQALGPHDNHYIKPDLNIFELNEDTLLLLCSDGLSDNELVETHWQTHLSPLLSTSANLESGLHNLIALANQKNGHDNITAILVRIKVQPSTETTLFG